MAPPVLGTAVDDPLTDREPVDRRVAQWRARSMLSGVAVQVGDPGVEETVVGITAAGRARLMLFRRCGTACFRSVYAGVHSTAASTTLRPRRVRWGAASVDAGPVARRRARRSPPAGARGELTTTTNEVLLAYTGLRATC